MKATNNQNTNDLIRELLQIAAELPEEARMELLKTARRMLEEVQREIAGE